MNTSKNVLVSMLFPSMNIFNKKVMMSNTFQYLLVFLAPLLTALAPLQSALITLLILIILNYGSALICIFKSLITKKVKFALLRALFSNVNMKRFFKKSYEYVFAILTIGLFEIYILGLDNSAPLGESISLMRITIIGAGVIEVNQMFVNLECITGSNILSRVQNLIPEPIKKYFKI